jgi:hypothetical protein
MSRGAGMTFGRGHSQSWPNCPLTSPTTPGYGFPEIDFFCFVMKQNVGEISFSQGHVLFRFSEILSKNSAKRNNTKFYFINIYLCA